MKHISIVIPIHNRIEITKEGLKSLFGALLFFYSKATKGLKYEVIVVDDGSTDGSSEWISENYPDIHLLRGDGDLWWAGAINKGAKFAVEQLKSDYILLWNDDTVCDKAYFFELANICLGEDKYHDSILVSKILWLNEDEDLFNFGCYFNSKNGKKYMIGHNKKDEGQFNEIIKIDWSGGMGSLIPVQALRDANYFDEVAFPHYHADIDFFLRAKELGYKAYAVPGLRIWNRRETTGIDNITKIKDIKKVLLSNQSVFNFKQNFLLTRRHTSSPIAWLYFAKKYLILFLQSINKKFK